MSGQVPNDGQEWPEGKVELSRRHFIGLGTGVTATVALGTLLASCGGDDSIPDTETGAGATNDTEVPGKDANESPTTPKRGGELKWALSADPPNLDPHVSTGYAARAVKMQIYNCLVRYWSDGSIYPDLAEAWHISDDGLEYTFSLRRGVVFHDGTPFTAADVEASIRRIQTPEVGALTKVPLSVIKEIVIDDDYTVRFRVDQPNAALLPYLALHESAIMSKQFLDSGADPNTTMMGTGPFKFVTREQGVRIEVERNDNYFREELPYLDKIIFIPYPNEDTRIAALKSGEVDIAEYVPWKDMDAIEQDPDLELRVTPASSFMYLIYNVDRPPFDDVKFRRALGYSFDRNAIVEAAFFGRGSVITGGLIPESSWAHNPDLVGTYSYDPEKAKQLLSEAGYSSGVTVTLLSTSQYGMHQSTAEVCQQNLEAIGIDCQLELVDWATITRRHNEKDYEFRVQGTTTNILDPDLLTTFLHSEAVNTSRDGLADEQIDQWLAEARATLSEEERKNLYHQIEQRMLEIAPFTLLCWRDDGYGVRRNVVGFEVFPGALVFYSPWSVEQVSLASS